MLTSEASSQKQLLSGVKYSVTFYKAGTSSTCLPIRKQKQNERDLGSSGAMENSLYLFEVRSCQMKDTKKSKVPMLIS